MYAVICNISSPAVSGPHTPVKDGDEHLEQGKTKPLTGLKLTWWPKLRFAEGHRVECFHGRMMTVTVQDNGE